MDLFSKFPESYKYDQFVPKIREEKAELNDPNEDDNDKENTNISKAFENIKKVNALRKRNFIIMIIAAISYILVEFIFEDILKDFSVKIIENYSIKESLTKTVFQIINKIIGYFWAPAFFIVYLNYPLTYSFTYNLSFAINNYIKALLLLIYGIDRNKEIGIKEFFYSGSEKPNLNIQTIIVIYFGLWRLIRSKNKNKKNLNKHKGMPNIVFAISILVTIFTFLEEILIGQCSIHSCLLGVIIGVITYSIIFERFCIQFRKGKNFIKMIAKNFFFYLFVTIIEFSVALLLYRHYNGIEDLFEIFDVSPWQDKSINQNTMNKIVFKKSLSLFSFFFIILGIKKNYNFVNSKKNKNFYDLDDISQFNQDEKISTIFKRNILLSSPGIILMCLMNYLQYFYKLPFIYYLFADMIIFFNFSYVWFGIGVKKSLKKHLDEGRELEDYQNLNYSDNKNQLGNSNSNDNNNLNNLV